MKRSVFAFLELALIIAALSFLAEHGRTQNAVNSGFVFDDNGPCVPRPHAAGLCNDSGVLAVYDHNGIITHLPAEGPPGVPGKDGADGKDGATGALGPQGIPGKDAVFPQSMWETCPALPNASVPKGWTALCSFKLP